MLVLDQVRRLDDLAPEADEDVRGDVRVPGEPGERPVELAVVRAVVLHRAALPVDDRHHPVHVRVVLQEPQLADPVGDVLAGTRRAVHRADDREVVAGAVAEVVGLARAAVEAHERAVLGRRRQRGGRRRGMGIVPLERAELHVVDVDVLARGDGPAGEPDHLPVLRDRVALLDRPDGELVAHLDRRGQLEGGPVEVQLGAGRDGLGGDGDVVLRAEVDGVVGQRRGGHRCGSLRGTRRRDVFNLPESRPPGNPTVDSLGFTPGRARGG